MPQLDMFSWLNQVFSTTLVMILFYMLLILLFLPTTTAIFKGRTKLQNFRSLVVDFFNKQTVAFNHSTKTVLEALFVNNLVGLWQYAVKSNDTQIKADVNSNCYIIAEETINMTYLQASLVQLLPFMLSAANVDEQIIDNDAVEMDEETVEVFINQFSIKSEDN